MSEKEPEIDELVDDSDYGDDEEYEDDEVFQIRDPLSPPAASVYTTQELHRLIHEGHIDLSPPYQRAVVWSREKQMTLIDSIFRNFYIPPVLFFMRAEADDPDLPIRVCMDGKQRLSSIQAFFDGQIPYRDPKTKKSYYYTVPSSQTGKKLLIPPKYKQIFASKHITCVEFSEIEPSVERDIFQRVQLGVALTTAEKLAAISSPYADWITELELRHVRSLDDGLNAVLRWDPNRGKGFQGIAQLVYCIENLPKRSDPTAAKIGAWLQRTSEPKHAFKQQIEEVLTKYWIIATTDNLKQAFTEFTQPVAPVEFIFIGVLIAVLFECEDEDIADEILELRRFGRQQHRDVRTNSRVMGSFWDYLGEAAERHDVEYAWSLTTNGTTGGRKRKRKSDAGDDEEFRLKVATPIKNLSLRTRTRNGDGK